MTIDPRAGTPAQQRDFVDVPSLIRAYYTGKPDPAIEEHGVAFGTSGHRGSPLRDSFNECHLLAIAEAIARYRHRMGTTGPLLLGGDSHALSEPAKSTVLEVLAAHGIDVFVDSADRFTPTPAISLAILGRMARAFGRPLFEVPAGFKWFVNSLLDGTCGFAGEESAGASFLRQEGTPWTTDKDGILMGLLSVEMMSRAGKDLGNVHRDRTKELGEPHYARLEVPASSETCARLRSVRETDVTIAELVGEKVTQILPCDSGNAAPVGGAKVETANGWFAVRPSGTEPLYKIYAEIFLGGDHLAPHSGGSPSRRRRAALVTLEDSTDDFRLLPFIIRMRRAVERKRRSFLSGASRRKISHRRYP